VAAQYAGSAGAHGRQENHQAAKEGDNLNNKVTPRKKRAVESLLTNGDITAAAAAAGVSRTSLYRWLKDDNFLGALAEAEQAALASLSRRLVSLGDRAVGTLAKAMDDEGAPVGSKIRAADVTLGRLLQLRELYQLEERVSRLEEQLSGLLAI
jgi:hypothetical protein